MSDLWLHPTRFFAQGRGVGDGVGLLAAAYMAGLAAAINRMELEVLWAEVQGQPLDGIYAHAATSWLVYWTVVLIAALFSGAVIWVVGSWWYRLRIRWAGDPRPDPDRAREVYFTAGLIRTIPAVILVLVDTAVQPSSAASWEGGSWLALVALAFPAWAIVASYRGVRASFTVARGKAWFWFLALPLAHFAIVLALAGALGFISSE